MPARAKRLFVNINKYHKLDGGDEEVALHMARQAVDREYVMLNNHWIPKTAAEEIVRHDIDEDSLSESEGHPSPLCTTKTKAASSATKTNGFSQTLRVSATF
uniref:ORF59 protein n=1 Tax=Leucania separata nucleopolyhedrovirus TaxID=1307956 RepID=O55571_NPVLS|nr:ORF59 [Leucania separata nucleopolyhedrovirus]